MNLADIRKKAQKRELAQDQPVEPWHPAELPAAELPAAAGVMPTPVAPELPLSPALPDPLAAALPVEYDPYAAQAGGGFDPAAVILKGREASLSVNEVALKEEQSAASVELLCFKVADEEYAIDIMEIKEIMKPREVTEVPRVPSFVRGILSLRGNIIPIFDMRLRLGLPGAGKSERERVVVVKRNGGFCGVLVDEVVQVVRIAEDVIEPPPVVLEGMDRDFVQGIGRVGGRMLILLDMEKVLDVSLV